MTMFDAHNVYEIEFDVPARRRDAFEDWLSEGAVAWINHDAVEHFEVFRNDKGLSPEVKFVFGFGTLQDWATFVNSDEHGTTVEHLEGLTENREAVLWQRSAVKLDGADDPAVSDGGGVERRDAKQTVIQR